MKYALFIALLSLAFVFQFASTGSFAARGDGANVGGKLLKADGKPLAYTEIELVPVDAEKQINDARLLAVSAVGGVFNFKNVPDGAYTLSINFDEKPTATAPYETFFYPAAAKRDDAQILKIEAATKINDLVFRLPPPLAQRRINGKVIGTDGAPVADAFVVLRDIAYDDRSFALDIKTNRTGVFTLDGFENRRYYVAAIRFDRPPDDAAPPAKPILYGETAPFTLDAANANFTLIMRKIGEREKDRLPDRDVGMLISRR